MEKFIHYRSLFIYKLIHNKKRSNRNEITLRAYRHGGSIAYILKCVQDACEKDYMKFSSMHMCQCCRHYIVVSIVC